MNDCPVIPHLSQELKTNIIHLFKYLESFVKKNSNLLEILKKKKKKKKSREKQDLSRMPIADGQQQLKVCKSE